MGYPLEPSAEDMRAMGDAALDFVVRFLQGLEDAPASDLEGAMDVARRMRVTPPEFGRSFDQVLAQLADASERSNNPAGPGFMAFIPGGGLFASSLADLLANTMNRFVNMWANAPALTQIEWTVVRWMCDLFDYPEGARGVLTTGGSMANFSAIVTARRALLPEDFLSGVLYTSEQAHASVPKAAALAGFPPRNVRSVPTTADLRLDVDALRSMIRADRNAGLRPFCVVAAAGTTNTGTVDPLDDAATVCAEEGLWFHVDAAYGGFFRLTDRGRALFAGIDRADSITLDPHKGLCLPYGTGCLLVREGARLREAHYIGADYLQDMAPEGEIPNFTEYSPELSRDFRGLRVWLPLQLHGVGAFRESLEEKLDLARYLYEALSETPGLETPLEPDLTVVPFRYVGQAGAGSNDRLDDLNRQLLERINGSKRVFMSSTLLGGRFTIRPCVLVHRTHRDRIDEAIDIVRGAARDLESAEADAAGAALA